MTTHPDTSARRPHLTRLLAAARLTAAGFDGRVEHVLSPETIDGGGELGYRVR
ncbi:hypothetical protein ACSBQY_09475 [Micrococcus lylae]|uniref:hypothetical protein n=1 Tax=Micrococcus lylae TaxID=1273 RepID=UPI003EBD668B